MGSIDFWKFYVKLKLRRKNKNYGGKMSLFENFVYKNGEIVDNSWVKWHHFGVPDEEGSERESMREFMAMLGHCKSCTVLSGCFFVKSRLPKKQGAGKGLLHNNCDCELIKIAKPTKQIEAICDIRKFSGYVPW